MKINKKQEKAVAIAIDVMETCLSNGIDSGEDGKLDFAISELIRLLDQSIKTRKREKEKEVLKM